MGQRLALRVRVRARLRLPRRLRRGRRARGDVRRRGHVDAETVERRRQADAGAAVHDGPDARGGGDPGPLYRYLDLPRGGKALVVREDRRAVAQVVVRDVDGLGQASLEQASELLVQLRVPQVLLRARLATAEADQIHAAATELLHLSFECHVTEAVDLRCSERVIPCEKKRDNGKTGQLYATSPYDKGLYGNIVEMLGPYPLLWLFPTYVGMRRDGDIYFVAENPEASHCDMTHPLVIAQCKKARTFGAQKILKAQRYHESKDRAKAT